MAKGYWIAHVDVRDRERYQAYVAGAASAFKAFGARFMVRGGEYTGLEGTARARNVVIEFPTYQAALDCYHSPDYQAAKRIRQEVADADLVIVEGVDG